MDVVRIRGRKVAAPKRSNFRRIVMWGAYRLDMKQLDEKAESNRWNRFLMYRRNVSSALNKGIHHEILAEPFQVILKFSQVGCC
jgi:hypothetical protein